MASIKQDITVSLDREVLRKVKVLAARRGISTNGFLARQIEKLVSDDEAYEQAKREALTLLDKGFHLGGKIPARRDEWHEL